MKKFLTLFVLVCPLLALAQQTRQITGQVLDRADGDWRLAHASERVHWRTTLGWVTFPRGGHGRPGRRGRALARRGRR